MSWNKVLAEEFFQEEHSPITRTNTQEEILCAYKRGEVFEISGDGEIHLATTTPLKMGEQLEDDQVILTIIGSPGPTTQWEYKIYLAKVKVKPGQEINVEWLD